MKKPNRSQRTLLIIATICVLPLVAALVLRFVWAPPAVASLGELIPPQPLAYERLMAADGRPLAHASVADRWLIVFASPASKPFT